MSRVRQALAISSLFLRRSLLHPHTLAMTLFTPIVIALLFGTADARAVSQVPIGVMANRSVAGAKAFVDAVDAEPGTTLRTYKTQVGLIRAVRRGDIAAGVMVPDDPKTQSVTVIGETADPVFEAARAQVISIARRGGMSFADAKVDLNILKTTKAARQNGLPRAAAGMLVYGVLGNAAFTSWLLLEDRNKGVFLRMTSSPVRASTIAAGEMFGRFLVAMLQGVTIALVTSLLFGTTWGAVVPFAFVLVALAAMASAASVLLGVAIARPGNEAQAVATAVMAIAAMIGGCFWSLANVPSAMRTLGYFTPIAWLLRAIETLVARGGNLVNISGDLAIVAGFVAALLISAALFLRRVTVVPKGAP